MNVAAANNSAAYAPTTYELCLVPSLVSPVLAPAPKGTFVTTLIATLSSKYTLDAASLELAELLLYGRSIGAIARKLGLATRAVQQRCTALFALLSCDGRQALFELATRLTTMRELANHLMLSNTSPRLAA